VYATKLCRCWTCWTVLCFAALLAAGCKSMTPGDLTRVQPYSDRPMAGNAYLLRGFIGIWSYGIDGLGQKIDAAGVRASVFQENQWHELAAAIAQKYRDAKKPEPLVLIGHSYGADDTLRIAKLLQEENITIDLIITLDPVTPPKVPSNVRLCYNIYQSNSLDPFPFFRGIKLQPETEDATNLVNVNIRTDRRDLLEPGTDHFNIEKNARIHEEVVRKLHEFCPPRHVWLAQQRPAQPPSAATNFLPPDGLQPDSVQPQRVGTAATPVQTGP